MKINTQLYDVKGKNSIMASFGKFTILCLVLSATAFLSSCEKEETEDSAPSNIVAPTGLRLVHSSFKNSATPVDLFIDDNKVTSASNIAFLTASTINPLPAGSHKISAKTSTGTVVADTTMNITDATQYSLYIKDRAWTTGTVTAALKTGFVAVPDNNTPAPADGMAKIRFVNAGSGPLNGPTGSFSFSRVALSGYTTTATIISQSLGLSNGKLYSDYVSLAPGTYTFRVNAASAAALLDPVAVWDVSVTLEAGKLYTAFGTSTQYTVKTPSKSPVGLNIIPAL